MIKYPFPAIQLLLVVLPLLLWRYINDTAARLACALFVINLAGYIFFRILQGYFPGRSRENSPADPATVKPGWIGLLVQLLMLAMIYLYAWRMLRLIGPIQLNG